MEILEQQNVVSDEQFQEEENEENEDVEEDDGNIEWNHSATALSGLFTEEEETRRDKSRSFSRRC